MFNHDDIGNDESFRVTRVAKDDKGNIIKRTGLHQAAQPTFEEYTEAERKLKKWAWVQTEYIMSEMAKMSPEELAQYEWDEETVNGNRIHEQEKEYGD